MQTNNLLMHMKLDEIDLNILIALQDDGRITKTKLAEKVHLSVSPCHERLKRLEQAGYIEGYFAKIDIALWCGCHHRQVAAVMHFAVGACDMKLHRALCQK